MSDCGSFEVVCDAKGVIVSVGRGLLELLARPARDLVGLEIRGLFRGLALSLTPGEVGPLELRVSEKVRPGFGVRTFAQGMTRLTWLPALPETGSRQGARPVDLAPLAHARDALAGVVGHAHLAGIAPTPQRRRFHLEQVSGEAQRCRRLLGSLQPGRSGTPGPFDLSAILERGLVPLRLELERHGIAFEIAAPSDAPTPAWGDAAAFTDLLIALIERATVARRRELQAREVAVALRRGAERHEVEVALTGADRPSHLLHDTFGADEVPTESALAALRAGFESDGGKLLVRRDDSLETVHLRVDVPSCPAPELRTHSGALEVLVIEDDAALGDLYEDLLRSVGHAVTACRGLVSAREALQRQRFDAVVAEFQLRDGHLSELAAEVVADHPELPARTLVVTRDPRHPRLLEWVGSTRRPVLGKPFDVHELFAQVQALGA